VKAGLADADGKALVWRFADFDNAWMAGHLVANDSVRQALYHNKGDGTFEDIAVMAGAGYDEKERPSPAWVVDCADYDNDGCRMSLSLPYQIDISLFRNNGDSASPGRQILRLWVKLLCSIQVGAHTLSMRITTGCRDIFCGSEPRLDKVGGRQVI